DVRTLSAWQEVDAIDRRRMLDAARRYVVAEDPATDEWLGTGILNWAAFAGFKALVLLLQESPDDSVLSDQLMWLKWALVVVGYAGSIGDNTTQDIVQAAYRAAASEVLAAFETLIDRACERLGRIYNADALDVCWDQRVVQFLLGKVRYPGLKPGCLG